MPKDRDPGFKPVEQAQNPSLEFWEAIEALAKILTRRSTSSPVHDTLLDKEWHCWSRQWECDLTTFRLSYRENIETGREGPCTFLKLDSPEDEDDKMAKYTKYLFVVGTQNEPPTAAVQVWRGEIKIAEDLVGEDAEQHQADMDTQTELGLSHANSEDLVALLTDLSWGIVIAPIYDEVVREQS